MVISILALGKSDARKRMGPGIGRREIAQAEALGPAVEALCHSVATVANDPHGADHFTAPHRTELT